MDTTTKKLNDDRKVATDVSFTLVSPVKLPSILYIAVINKIKPLANKIKKFRKDKLF
ncbi:hypothetical protein J32TS6_30670 [Virgibacillus pantothenticus]|uniref:hypothetical protein n=1 Tax=Virgibacillus pantothenticus TaxID=1473 RepID=UPI0012FF1991|nr:hypothetical protein [Virgibacillus pantothenticus]GIP64512.1 hypothetical protein J32TS6_30670 [Virgibacillus pantothenticus]